MALSKESATFILEEASKLLDQHLCIIAPTGKVIASLNPEECAPLVPDAATSVSTGDLVTLDNSKPP